VSGEFKNQFKQVQKETKRQSLCGARRHWACATDCNLTSHGDADKHGCGEKPGNGPDMFTEKQRRKYQGKKDL